MPLPHLVRSWRTFLTCMLTAAATALALALALPATAAPTHNTSGTAATVGDPGQPQPQSTADTNSGGANGQCPDGPYCSTRGEGTGQAQPSGNGNQTQGKHTGEPCAGCVGKADNKNPKGQMPNGSDHNAGYECDRNHGIGRTNPAHTGCTTTTSDCTTNPTGPGCQYDGGGDCTTNPTGPGCQYDGDGDCTTNPDAAGCDNSGGGTTCVPTKADNFCSDVLGEKQVRKPGVQGEKVVNTPGSLPFTGSNVAALLMTGMAGLLAGSALLVAGGRRRRGMTRRV
jgi:hypothetical protein